MPIQQAAAATPSATSAPPKKGGNGTAVVVVLGGGAAVAAIAYELTRKKTVTSTAQCPGPQSLIIARGTAASLGGQPINDSFVYVTGANGVIYPVENAAAAAACGYDLTKAVAVDPSVIAKCYTSFGPIITGAAGTCQPVGGSSPPPQASWASQIAKPSWWATADATTKDWTSVFYLMLGAWPGSVGPETNGFRAAWLGQTQYTNAAGQTVLNNAANAGDPSSAPLNGRTRSGVCAVAFEIAYSPDHAFQNHIATVAGARTDAASWVTACFQTMLRRTPDAGGLATFERVYNAAGGVIAGGAAVGLDIACDGGHEFLGLVQTLAAS